MGEGLTEKEDRSFPWIKGNGRREAGFSVLPPSLTLRVSVHPVCLTPEGGQPRAGACAAHHRAGAACQGRSPSPLGGCLENTKADPVQDVVCRQEGTELLQSSLSAPRPADASETRLSSVRSWRPPSSRSLGGGVPPKRGRDRRWGRRGLLPLPVAGGVGLASWKRAAVPTGSRWGRG